MACQTCQYFINKLFFFEVLNLHLFSSLEDKWGLLPSYHAEAIFSSSIHW